VLPKIEVAAGVRYTHETKDSFLRQVYVNAALQGLFVLYDPNNPSTNVTANQKFNNWSPEATITYKPTENITVYGAYKTAYKSGGFSNSAFVIVGAPASNVAFQPEKAHGFEGGIKTTLFDNQLRFNVDAYTYKYTNLQVDFFDSITFQFITTNAGAATTKGVEAEFEYAPRAVPGLNLHGSLNYNRARYQNYLAPCYGGQSIAQGCNTYFIPAGSNFTPAPGAAFTGQDLSGHPTAIAPRWTASLGFDYERSIGHGLHVGLSSDGRYSSTYLGSSFGEPLSRQSKYISLDATLRVGAENDRWELAVIGRNLSNNFHISGVLDAPNSGIGTGTNNALPADMLGLADLPRTVRVQLTVRY
jgi:outer membrane receptor protein involved in Fe transport